MLLEVEVVVPQHRLVGLRDPDEHADHAHGELVAEVGNDVEATPADERVEELEDDIRPTGYFRQKTKWLRGTMKLLIEEFDGKVPRRLEDLIRLPGVARKTANIVQGNAYPKEHAKDPDAGIAVDTHVKRLAHRLGFSDQSDPDKIERGLMRLIPRETWFSFTYVLIDHGRALCVARNPRCEVCPVSDLCPASRV